MALNDSNKTFKGMSSPVLLSKERKTPSHNLDLIVLLVINSLLRKFVNSVNSVLLVCIC